MASMAPARAITYVDWKTAPPLQILLEHSSLTLRLQGVNDDLVNEGASGPWVREGRMFKYCAGTAPLLEPSRRR